MLDTTGHIPSRGQRLLSLHEPARRDAIAARGLERIVNELAEQLRVAEGELGFDRDDRGIAVLGDRGTLAGLVASRRRVTDPPTRKPTNGVMPPPTTTLSKRGGFVLPKMRLVRSGDVSMTAVRASQRVPETVAVAP